MASTSNRKTSPNKKKKNKNLGNESDEEPFTKVPKTENGQEGKINFTSEGNLIQKIIEARFQCSQSIANFRFNKKRVRLLSKAEIVPEKSDGILYWMARDQRVQDNWAFLYSQRWALKCDVPLHVCFCLVPKFLDATIRHYNFMLKGLKEVEQECKQLNITFHLLLGEAKNVLPTFIKSNNIGGLVTDFAPLRVPMQWIEDVKNKLPSNIPFCQVDAHNIVPCWVASDKLEYAARTIRSKIHGKLSEYLTEFPPVICHPHSPKVKYEKVDWLEAENSLEVDKTITDVKWAVPGTKAGLEMLEQFTQKRLKNFADKRNDPTKESLSNLSPWIHFGQISVQRCILVVKQFKSKFGPSVDAFIEEAMVRRELADNFCFYNPNYDKLEGAYDWAKKTLNDHKKDKREYIYTRQEFEEGKTHDDLWNAAQIQMVKEGKMHGFLRMYWAKKILEWTETPEEALAIAIYLNDKYELDGRDPNGYVGCMWSICGIHDQGWGERAIFGKIRFMNYAGCKRKFDVNAFVSRYGGKVYKNKGSK